MKGFKNTTKTVPGHLFPDSGAPGSAASPPPVARGEGGRFASGGIVAPMGGTRMPQMSGPRPIMPRPRAMPNMKMESMPKVKLAKGGSCGNALEKANPYSQIEKEHPRKEARPGYAFGGIKRGALHKDMGIPQGKKIPVSKIRTKLAKDKAHGNAKGVKRDVFAINAKTKFATGGPVRNLAFMSKPLFGKG